MLKVFCIMCSDLCSVACSVECVLVFCRTCSGLCSLFCRTCSVEPDRCSLFCSVFYRTCSIKLVLCSLACSGVLQNEFCVLDNLICVLGSSTWTCGHSTCLLWTLPAENTRWSSCSTNFSPDTTWSTDSRYGIKPGTTSSAPSQTFNS